MPTYMTMPDGTKCYSGPNCLRHSKRSLPADFASKPVAEQLADMEKLKNPLADNDPQNIDESIAVIYNNYYEVMGPVGSWKKELEIYQRNLARGSDRENVLQIYRDRASRLEGKISQAQQEGEEILKEVVPYEVEFKRRGGWTRGFLVQNANGHVHKNRSCSTCTYSTKYLWLTNYSGKNEEELVADAGEKACTVCFPSAPVESLRQAPNLNDPTLREEQANRAAIAKEKAAKAAAKAAKAITGTDGRELYTNYSGKIGTVVSAENYASDLYANLKAYRENIVPTNNPAYVESQKRDYGIILEALAKKNDMTVQEQEEALMPKFDRKFKKEFL